MNDNDIRKILLEYIKTCYQNMRIYQEKSIGASVCDVMVVADLLIGYEIKSDGDNYERLKRQIAAYDAFFRKNYIVVGKKHQKSAEEKVPEYWGILVIEEDGINVLREAKINRNIKIEKQLSVLWLLELKNLLNYFSMPMFAQKTKDFIQKKIVENVPADQLEKQIIYELMNRDYSAYGAKDYTIKCDNGSKSSASASITDLQKFNIQEEMSEMDFSQVTLDEWISIFRNAKQMNAAKEVVLDKKVERPRHAVTWEDIEVSLGVPWISKEIIQDFIDFVKYADQPGVALGRATVFYEPITGNWQIEYKTEGNHLPRCFFEYGTSDYNALYIIEATLNNREIRLYNTDHKYDEERTLAALEKQKSIRELFSSWVWEDEDRKWAIEESYNKMFGRFKKEIFDGSSLVFPGLNEKYELFDYQKDAVQRIISTPNTLLAFDVGSGKTFIMITAAMLMRERGLSRKNMFVVPNNIVGQWEKIFTDLYPKAKLLVIEPKNYKQPLRQKILGQIKNGDYDGIIIAYSCFEQIPLSKEILVKNAKNKLSKLDEAVKNHPVWSHDNYSSNYSRENQYIIGKLNERRTEIVKLMNELLLDLDRGTDITEEITFEKLEINTIFLDEAHNYKNLKIETKMKNVRGISSGSAKCTDMLMKIRCVQDMNQGRGAVFATGTPLCNSLVDAYTMQVYLQNDVLKEMHLDIFDNWIKTFARPESVAEVDVTSQNYRYVTRFSKFFNLPELSGMFGQIAVFHAMDKDTKLPELKEYSDFVIPQNNELQNYMESLLKRSEEIRSGKIDRKYDNMLKVSTDGRKAALDLRLVEKAQSAKYSKISGCVVNVMKIYEEYDKSSQLIFCDYSTPKPGEFNVYKQLKDELMRRGVPEKEIAFIHSYGTEARKVKLFADVNAGIVRILIGSTFKLGIGANVQTKLKAIHHLDVPWRPADMVQREGRILRRGNSYKNIFIYRYICEGSFDAYSWQILEGKQKFISEFLSGSAYQRSASDLEENVLDYAQVKALALADPRMKDLAEIENKLSTTEILCRKWNESQAELDNRLNQTIHAIRSMNTQLKGADILHQILEGKTEDDYKELKKTIDNQITIGRIRYFEKSKLPIVKFWGISIMGPDSFDEKKPYFYIKVDNAKFMIESGQSGDGNIARVINFLKKIETTRENLDGKIAENEKELQKIMDQIKKDNPYKKRITELKTQADKLRKAVAGDNPNTDK